MTSPPDSEPARPKRGSPALAPSSLPSLSLPTLGRVREKVTSHAPPSHASRPRDSREQSNSRTDSELKNVITTFPDLVDYILERARAAPETPGPLSDGTGRVPHVQVEGRKIWEEFQTHATTLEKDLQKFQDAVQELGSSLDLVRAARSMRDNMSWVSQAFQENARSLFPLAGIPSILPRMSTGYDRRRSRSRRLDATGQFNFDQKVDNPPVPWVLNVLAGSTESLRLALEQFPEFQNAEIWPLESFEIDLQCWSSNLEQYKDRLDSPEVRLYIHDLSRELSNQFDDASVCLREIIDSVPTVRLSQKHDMWNLQSLATIATFFSAVTATTIQYSFGKNDTGVDKAVNLFWFNSLVFSIASALNSFLVLTWRKANYSAPLLRIPSWLWIWIRQCPTVFLLISVVTFLAGLGCFAISSDQARFTSIVVIISEVISAFGLAALSVRLVWEKWASFRHGQVRVPAATLKQDFENFLPTYYERPAPQDIPLENLLSDPQEGSVSSLGPAQRDKYMPPTPPPAHQAARADQRWKWAVKNVIIVTKALRVERGKEVLESLQMDNLDFRLRKLAITDELTALVGSGGEANDIHFDPHGRSLAVCGSSMSMRYELGTGLTDLFRQRMGRARQLEWSSSGEYLFTRTSRAIHVWTLVAQISPEPLSGDIFLQSVIMRDDTTHYIQSVPNDRVSEGTSPRILSVEGALSNKLVVIDIERKEPMLHDFKDIKIQHIDITPDGVRVLIAAVTLYGTEGIHPIKASPIRKLMVYNLKTRQVENKVPLWYDVHQVTVSANGKWVVVTYKDYPPPQLYHLHRTPKGLEILLERQFCARGRVSANEFDPSLRIRFLGRAHFVNNDRYVLCTTTDGKIHIWRRDRSHPVHVHGALTLDKDKPVQIACAKRSNEFMFATRSTNGTARIWKIQDPPAIHVNTPGHSESYDPTRHGILISRSAMTESPQDEDSSRSL